MADRLTQLQDAVDDLANQFVQSLHYINRHHDYKTLSPTDTVRPTKEDDPPPPIDPYPENVFKEDQKTLARDLIVKEQQIEYLVSVLPGLDNSERDQEARIKQLEEELKGAEEQRKQAVKEKEAVLARLESVIRSVKRP